MKHIVVLVALMLASPVSGKSADSESNKDYGVMSALKNFGKIIAGPNFSNVRAQSSPGSGQRVPLTNEKDNKASPGQFARVAQFEKAKTR